MDETRKFNGPTFTTWGTVFAALFAVSVCAIIVLIGLLFFEKGNSTTERMKLNESIVNLESELSREIELKIEYRTAASFLSGAMTGNIAGYEVYTVKDIIDQSTKIVELLGTPEE